MNLKRYKDFLNESKVATDESPLGFYLISNALMPDEFFSLLKERGIEFTHDEYRNLIEVLVDDLEQAKYARQIALDFDIFDASDIDEDDLPYMTPDEIGDAMEIKLKNQ